MKRKVLIISVFVLFMSVYFLIRHYGDFDEKSYTEKIMKANLLIKEGQHVTAFYDSVYSEYKRRGNTAQKSIKYFYKVNGKVYEDQTQIVEIPDSASFQLIYLPANPEMHSTDPLKDKLYFEKQKDKKSTATLPWFFLVASLVIIIYTIKNLLKENAQQKEMEALSRQYKS